MKKVLIFSLAYLLICSFAYAQDEKRGITKAEFATVKALSVKNLEKDTYVKTDNGFILDRYESRPAYVFKFSDGIERRIYLYKVFEADKMKEIAMLAFFVTPKDGKQLKLCIPNTLADKEVWGIYIDDMKDNDKKISGFSTCVAFVLSREFSGGGKTETASGDDYEYCFPADAKVRLADGTEKAIAQIQPGDAVLSFNTATQSQETTEVEELIVHEGKAFSLTKVLLQPEENSIAANGKTPLSFAELEATSNHPVFTAKGRKKLGDVVAGDVLYVFDNQEKAIKKHRVHAVFAESRKVEKVYNLKTTKETYAVNGVVVFKK